MSIESVDVRIRGKEYRVHCSPEERAALDAALALLEARLEEVANRTHSSGEKLATMVALNLAHEILAAEMTSTSPAGNSVDAPPTRRRIAAIEAKLNAASGIKLLILRNIALHHANTHWRVLRGMGPLQCVGSNTQHDHCHQRPQCRLPPQ